MSTKKGSQGNNDSKNGRRNVKHWNNAASNDEINRHNEKVMKLHQQQKMSKKSMEKMTIKILENSRER